MIKASDIFHAVADAIEANATVRDLFAEFKDGYRLLVGHSGDEAMQHEDNRAVIAISAPPNKPYNLGWQKTRTLPVRISVRTWGRDVPADGYREEYVSAVMAHDLCHAICEAIKYDAAFGDDLADAQVEVDTTLWPYCVGTINLNITWTVALNNEATI